MGRKRQPLLTQSRLLWAGEEGRRGEERRGKERRGEARVNEVRRRVDGKRGEVRKITSPQ